MKLLILIHRLPCPADRGSKLRAAAELRYLAKRHEVWCAGLLDSPGSPETHKALAELRNICEAVAAIPLRSGMASARALGALITGGTATEAYFSSKRLSSIVERWSAQVRFDAVLACSSSMAPLALSVPAGRRVLDFVDIDSRKWEESVTSSHFPMSLVYRTEANRLGRRELQWMNDFDASVVCAERETLLLGPDAPRDRVHVIETGAVADADTPLSGKEPVALPDEPVVGFLGAMDYEPNVEAVCWFSRSIWPRVRRVRQDAEFLIVGRSPGIAVKRLTADPSIHVTGTVPAVDPYLEQMRVMVAPLRLARGLQTKVLTAMAAGLPCVVTSCVAEGIGAEAGSEILVANSEQGIADLVLSLLKDKARAMAIGTAARDFVARKYQAAASLERLESLLQGGVGTPACAEMEGALS